MAAILTPNRSAEAFTPPRRPALRLVDVSEAPLRRPAGRTARRSVAAELGLDSVALLMVSIAFLVVIGGVIALGQGRFSDLATDPASSAPAATAAAATPAMAVAAGTTVTVRSGDTMWSIARRLQPSGDVRPLVDALVAANGGSSIAPGDRVVVPG